MYEVAGAPDWVAKVYHKPPAAAQADKLRAMVGLARPELHAVAAWPTAVLSDRPGGPVAGLVMPRVKGFQEVHTLYSPAQRKVTFPRADWTYLVHVAANCAAAFDIVHAFGVVVGDVNQSNVLVSGADGKVAFIDCDSFQIQAGGRTYPCEVGVPLFTPPELIGRSFRGLVRTVHHDTFGLAVLVFHLLFMGRHPFAGRYAGPGDMPIETAIKQFRFAYGRSASGNQMRPPLHTLPLSAVSPALGSLFERAFGPQASAAGRPSPAEWYNGLLAFRNALRVCPADPGHRTPPDHPGCVWCDLMRQGAPNFFVSVAFTATAGTTFAIAAVWARIEAVPCPDFIIARPLLRAGRVPTPWPAGLPARVPPPPPKPAVLTVGRTPSDPVLPSPRYSKVALPYTTGQRVVGYVLIAALTLSIPCWLGGAVLGSALGIGRGPGGWVVGGCGLPVGLTAVAILAILELRRRGDEEYGNRFYRAERRERRRLVEEQLAAWEQAFDEELRAAEQDYRSAREGWERVASRVRGEAARRRAAAESAAEALGLAEAGWVGRLARFREALDRKKRELTQLRDRHAELGGQLAAERQQLLGRARDIQLAAYLQQHFIEGAAIPDIGRPGRRPWRRSGSRPRSTSAGTPCSRFRGLERFR